MPLPTFDVGGADGGGGFVTDAEHGTPSGEAGAGFFGHRGDEVAKVLGAVG